MHDVHVTGLKGFGEAWVETIGVCQEVDGALWPALPEG